MAGTKLQLNWTGVAVGATAISNVESFDIAPNDSFAPFAADNSRYPTIAVKTMSTPTATIVTADIGTAMGLRGTTGVTVTATHLDAKDGSGGDILYSLDNCYVANVAPTGPFGQYGKATITLGMLSDDGATDPISFTRA